VETGYLPVIGLCDIMCHVAAVLERKAAGEVKCNYIISHYVNGLRELTHRAQCNQTLSTEQSRLVAARYSCILLSFFSSLDSSRMQGSKQD